MKFFKKIVGKLIAKKTILEYLIDEVEIEILYSLKRKYLTECGWVNSFENKEPLSKNNNPLPWMTYPFIDFIENRLHKNLSIFEYGSGNSSLYFAPKVKEIFSVEHDTEWYSSISEGLKVIENAHLFYQELEYGGKYSNKINELNKCFDIVIVDGRDRVNCCINSFESLSEEGILVLDDSHRKRYSPAIEYLIQKGMRKIDFWGFAPGLSYKKATSVFYRENNCFKI